MGQVISIQFDAELDALLTTYTENHGMSKAAYIQQVVSERLVEWESELVLRQALKDWQADGFRTKSWQETLQELHLDD
ncbi:hypothetical protein [Levilactobacillus tongjiangensis]|uniref:CopG family transcriptional regulator n=1 Tax=Levilactobacillus tongjiangensis TaxID=2486023 RepID=A0ABW1SQL2_9LACO|nr:hypothetical protein [Levilactobacillus tongjiangensis]